MKYNIGDIIDDYEIIDDMGRSNNHRQYKMKCKICGHIKTCSDVNITKQDNHHSLRNCKDDYYKRLIGNTYGDYECIGYYKSENNGYLAKCKCKICGHIGNYHYGELNNNLKHNSDRCENDYYSSYIGKVVGDFTIIEYAGNTKFYHYYYCKCNKCGEIIKKSLNALLRTQFKHGLECFKAIKDDLKYTFTSRLDDIQARCNNPNHNNYNHYGGRGIKCEYEFPVDLYHDFIDEFREYLKTHDIIDCEFDRIDVNGNYTKDNLRIASNEIQNANRRTRRFFTMYNPKTKESVISDSVGIFGRKYGLNPSAVSNTLCGRSKTVGDDKWIPTSIFYDPNKIQEYISNENVTTNLIVSL